MQKDRQQPHEVKRLGKRQRKRTETKSRSLFNKAQSVLVGGVNSPVRSFGGVRRQNPLFIARAQGSKIYDADGNRYIDYVCSWGASILGSANREVVSAVKVASGRGLSYGAPTSRETELAEMVKVKFPSMDLMRFVCSGTEATMSAVRVARAYSKKEKILKFEGCYHGHADEFLVRAGSGLATFTIASSAGVQESLARQTLLARYNDSESVERALAANKGEVAAIIVEPVAGNMGVVPPKRDFLQELRKLADDYGSLLIFDEVITGFRVSGGGAQLLYGVKPDLTCLGKVIGGGMNVAAYGGREEIMRLVSPLGSVYQAGTLAGNPVAVASGIATLKQLTPSLYQKLESRSGRLEDELSKAASKSGMGDRILTQRVGSMLGLFFPPPELKEMGVIENYDDVILCSKERYSLFFGTMLDEGVYLPPSAYETCFVSSSHSPKDVVETARAAEEAFARVSAEPGKPKEMSEP